MKALITLSIAGALALTACSGGNQSGSQSTAAPSAEPTSIMFSQAASPAETQAPDQATPSPDADAEQAAPDAPWAHATAGTRAYLTDDGGAATVATVCKTPEALHKTFDGETPASCAAHPHGTLVTILGTQPDDAWANGTSLIADVEVQGDGFTGWVPIMELEPLVPAGTHLTCTTIGNATPEIFPSATSPLKDRVELGSPASVQLIKQYRYTGDANWYVRVLSGKHAGETGYMVAGCRVPGSKYDANSMPWDTKTGEPL